MKPELTNLEKLFLDIQKANNAAPKKQDELFLEEIANGLHDESNRLRNALIKASYKCKEASVFKLYVNHHQAGLIKLANDVWDYKNNTSAGDYSVFNLCISIVDDLLQFMSNSFGDYFNGELSVPNYLHDNTKPIIQKQASQLRRQLKQNSISEELQAILLTVFDAYLQKREGCFSYDRYDYLCYLHSKLQSFSSEQQLAELLFVANFNNSRFFLYSVNNLQLALQANTGNLLLTIARLIKANNQTLINTDKGLHKAKASIQTMVSRWLYEELSYCEIQKPIGDNALRTPAMKVKLNLSVDELGYFVDLFEKTNVLESSSRTGVSKALAEICSTKERDVIKWKSLYNNSYSVAPYTQSSVKDILLKMLNIATKKVYFLILFLDVDLSGVAANL